MVSDRGEAALADALAEDAEETWEDAPALRRSLGDLTLYLCAILALIVIVLYFMTKSSRRAQRRRTMIALLVVVLYFMTNSAILYTNFMILYDPENYANVGVFTQLAMLLGLALVLVIVYMSLTKDQKSPEGVKEQSVEPKKHDKETPVGVTKRKHRKS